MMTILATWKPPDGGWGWVIAVVSLLLHGQTLGMMLCMSLMYVSWLEAFGDSRGVTSWVMSIGVAVMFGLGPVPAALANRYGFRIVVIVGGLLVSAGYILSYFATSVAFLVVSIGLIGGLGCCFGYLSAVAIVSVYFDKRRSIAMGIGTSGVGIGALIAAPLMNFLTESYGWRGALLIIGGASLNICAYGLLIRPVQECNRYEEEIVLEVSDDQIKDESLSFLGSGGEKINGMAVVENTNENINDSSQTIGQTPIVRVITSSREPIGASIESDLGKEHKRWYSRLSIQLLSEIHNVERPYSSLKDLAPKREHQNGLLVPHYHLKLKNSMGAIFVRSVKQVDKISLLGASDDFLQTVDVIGDQPIQDLEMSYPIEDDRNETYYSSCMKALKDSIRSNIEILKDPMFLLFGISNIVTNLSYITPAMYLVDRAMDSGLDTTAGAILVASNGAGNICGRLFFGAITYRVFPDRFMTYIVVLSLGGFFTMISPLCGTNVVLHGIYAFLIGAFIGGYAVLVAVVTVDIMGLSKASDSFGLLLTFMGFATLIGPPFGGVLFDWSRSYTFTYILYGFFLIGSVLMLLPAAFKRRRKMRREKREVKRKEEEEERKEQERKNEDGISLHPPQSSKKTRT